MKTTITADGTLRIVPETELEAFALNHWCKENITQDWYDAHQKQLKFIVDMSDYAATMGIFVTIPGEFQ